MSHGRCPICKQVLPILGPPWTRTESDGGVRVSIEVHQYYAYHRRPDGRWCESNGVKPLETTCSP